MSAGNTPRVAVLLVAAAVGVTACRERAVKRPLQVVKRFVAERYQLPDDTSTVAVPTAVVAGERRPVLASSPSVLLGRELSPALRGRRAVIDVHVPEQMQSAPMRIWSFLHVPQASKAAITAQRPRAVGTPGREAKVKVGFNTRLGATWISIYGRAGPPEKRYETAPFIVPRDARLRLGIGLDETDWPPGLPPVTFTLTAIADDHEEVLLRTRLQPGANPDERRWFDHDLDLARYADRTVRLRFESVPEAEGDSVPFPFPVWSDPTILAPAPAGQQRRNVFLISVDTLRPDHLGCYGYGRPTSPTIDSALAAQGTVFENAFAQATWTLPSHAVMLTGVYPCAERIFPARGVPTDPHMLGWLPPQAATLAELLRAHGYATAAFTEDSWVSAVTGFHRGCDTFVETSTVPRMAETTGEVEKTLGGALRWIEQHQDTPWFVFAHTFQVHDPYTPPPGYTERVAPEHGTDEISANIAAYDGEIRYTDDVLARFLAGLEAAGAADALIIVTSDHGEQFGERDRRLVRHGNSLYDDLLHVALIMRAPGLVPAGKRIKASVGLIDIVPTVLELLGLPPPRWTEGRSVAPLLHDGEVAPVRLFAELEPQVAVRSAQFKWIIDEKTGATQAFDLAADPHETANLTGVRELPGDPAKLVAEYRTRCATPAPPPVVLHPDQVDPVLLEKLKALGYVK